MRTQGSTRELILAAAEAEFLEKGYKAAALRDIAGRAGVTTGALYGCFKNKEDLFAALAGEEYHCALDMYDQLLAEFHALPPERQMAEMQAYSARGMVQMADYIYDHWSAFKLLLCCSEGTGYCHLVDEMAQRNIQATDAFSDLSHEAGVPLRDPNPTLERMLTYSMFSVFFDMVRQDLPREETEQYIHQLLDFFTGGWETLWGRS